MTNWQDISGNWVLIPKHPIAILHFLGGAFVGTAPQISYRWLLEKLVSQGYAIVATPFVNTLEHHHIAETVLKSFDITLENLRQKSILRRRYLPIYGIGHSMGCKLHLLIGSLFSVNRAGNILISFNNYAASDAIPLVEQLNLNSNFKVEFTPTPSDTKKIIVEKYNIPRNLLLKFNNDQIDQSSALNKLLTEKFAQMVTIKLLSGNHLTPLCQDFNWQAGKEFTAFDALGQWVKQEVIYKDINQLNKEIIRWLEPFSNH